MPIWKNRRPNAAAPNSTERRGFLKRMLAFVAGGAVVAAARPNVAKADGDPFLGEIALVPYNFEPRGWAFCDGQLLAISQNTALFALLGTTYGGNGQTTFALPDLRGRTPIHAGGGPGPGLSQYLLGQTSGVESVTLSTNQMPTHNHVLNANSANGTSDTPANGVMGKNASGVPQYSAASNAAMAAAAIGNAGGNQAHENRPPSLGLNYVIALQGIFPSRN